MDITVSVNGEDFSFELIGGESIVNEKCIVNLYEREQIVNLRAVYTESGDEDMDDQDHSMIVQFSTIDPFDYSEPPARVNHHSDERRRGTRNTKKPHQRMQRIRGPGLKHENAIRNVAMENPNAEGNLGTIWYHWNDFRWDEYDLYDDGDRYDYDDYPLSYTNMPNYLM